MHITTYLLAFLCIFIISFSNSFAAFPVRQLPQQTQQHHIAKVEDDIYRKPSGKGKNLTSFLPILGGSVAAVILILAFHINTPFLFLVTGILALATIILSSIRLEENAGDYKAIIGFTLCTLVLVPLGIVALRQVIIDTF